MSFVHLHNHSHYSLLDGLSDPAAYAELAKQQGSSAVALTDHGVLYGAIEFYKAAKKTGIKPIIGVEAYMTPGKRTERDLSENKIYHILLLAETDEGYKNLLQLVTRAHLEGFYYKPRIDAELFQQYGKGIIALSGCLIAEIPRAILDGDMRYATELIEKYKGFFGRHNFFLELQDHPHLAEQTTVNTGLLELAKKTGTPLVATNDAHYAHADDKEAHDILLCIQTNKKVHETDRMKYDDDFSLRSPEDMRKVFSHIPGAIENTLAIAERCNVTLHFDQNLLPAFPIPANTSADAYVQELAYAGMRKRYPAQPKDVRERLDYELSVIQKTGFATYFLIIADAVNFAKKNGIVVGPGRGSAAGSLVSYCLGITDLDPLRYGLLFERFLNPDRVTRPDIDIDFADNRRDEVLHYVVEKYGKDRVAQICTFGTMAARQAVRDVGRALGIPYGDVDVIAKLIPGRPGTQLNDAIEHEPMLREKMVEKPMYKKLLDMAGKLEGVVRHASVHACAVVISPHPLTDYTPLQKAPGRDDTIITQYSMKPIEDIGLLKMDFLGLKNLTILKRTIDNINHSKGETLDLEAIPMDDAPTYELLQRAETTGVFQLESSGMKRYLKELVPTQFEDIIAMVALYRPGPMEWIHDYVAGKHGKKKINYFHPSLEKILRETYGIAVYQEQILQIVQTFAGFTLGEADILRRAIGKKIMSELMAQRTKFIEGAIRKGHPEKLVVDIFEKVIEPFAGYGFNKSHAAGYALIAYHTAYLKAHYPAEFMAALLTSDQSNTDRIIIEINECEAMGIRILPPDINESLSTFTVVSDTAIRFGLAAVKGIGEGTVADIIRVREESGPFRSLADFAERVPVKLLNKKTIEALARSGALDSFGERNQLSENVDAITQFAKKHAGGTETPSLQGGLFDHADIAVPDASLSLSAVTPATPFQKLKWEKEYLGLYVSSHPLQGLTKYLAKKVDLIGKLDRKKLGRSVKLGGLLTDLRRIQTRAGASMLSFTLEDPTGRLPVIVFPTVYRKLGDIFQADTVLVLEGKLEVRRGELQCVCTVAKTVSLDSMVEKAKRDGFFDPNERIEHRPKATLSEEESPEAPDTGDAPLRPFLIRISSSANTKDLETLKTFLRAHKGDHPVELEISNRRIPIPFGIDLSPHFKKELAALAVAEGTLSP